jgi:hypothetical protein
MDDYLRIELDESIIESNVVVMANALDNDAPELEIIDVYDLSSREPPALCWWMN